MENLRITETNAGGDESAGDVWGLRYDLLLVGLVGLALSILVTAALFATGRVSLITMALAGVPTFLATGFALFRQTHPPGYDTDLLDFWLHGPGFGPKPPSDMLP